MIMDMEEPVEVVVEMADKWMDSEQTKLGGGGGSRCSLKCVYHYCFGPL